MPLWHKYYFDQKTFEVTKMLLKRMVKIWDLYPILIGEKRKRRAT